MSDLITYDDKIRLKSQNVSDKYKVTAEDMNEIKNVVNAHADVIDEINKPENWVSVGTEEPTDGERVWFEKGKNLFNNNVERKSAYISNPNSTGQVVAYSNSSATYSFINCCALEQGKTYTISWTQSQTSTSTSTRQGCLVDSNNIIRQGIATWELSNNYVSFTANSNGFLILCTDIYATNIQIEEGSNATSYEPYIEPSINVDGGKWYSKGMIDNIETRIDDIETRSATRVSYLLSTTIGWKRIAKMSGMSGGTMMLANTASYGTFGEFNFTYAGGFGNTFTKIYKIITNGHYFNKARIVQKGNSEGYLELYQQFEYSRTLTLVLSPLSQGVSLYTQETEGSIPDGYAATEYTFT